MISWIVASHKPDVLEANLLASLNAPDDDEIIVVTDAPSITVAYAEGQEQAKKPIRCYVHSDVQVLEPAWLREDLIDYVTDDRGIVGVIGSRDVRMPWWEGIQIGSVYDSRLGLLSPDPLGGPCSILDGLLLATRQHVDWDVEAPSWHGYDHDACMQMLRRGLPNHCLPCGDDLVRHNTAGPTNVHDLTGWDDAVKRWKARWT